VRVPRALRKPPCAYTLRSPAIFRVFSFRLG
jgi:hypothetical protein